jgi:hypothetical protein
MTQRCSNQPTYLESNRDVQKDVLGSKEQLKASRNQPQVEHRPKRIKMAIAQHPQKMVVSKLDHRYQKLPESSHIEGTDFVRSELYLERLMSKNAFVRKHKCDGWKEIACMKYM